MKKNEQRNIEVCAHWTGLSKPTHMGNLHAIPGRGKEIFSFEYNPDWIKSGRAQILDPSLMLSQGAQFAPRDQKNFRLFLDSSPDRWGRFLMDRREALRAREESRKARALWESDYLLGVHDVTRMGALRFRMAEDGPFLSDDATHASPPWTSIRELEHASLELEGDNAEINPNYSRWLRMLISPGSSLGGARPKAGVVDAKGHLWIAKFPSRNDNCDMGAWEKVVHNLAGKAGVTIAQAEVQKFNSRYHTFLAKRFDRSDTGERIHFASAMTMLERSDGDDASTGVSYLHLAEFLMQHGANVERDLEQLWRRIVFFVCVSNVDDHLRNHGFLLTPKGWELCPAYDMNPDPNGDGLKLNISERDNSQDLGLVREVAEYFRIKPLQIEQIIQHVIGVVRGWRAEADSFGIASSEQDRMERAFRVAS